MWQPVSLIWNCLNCVFAENWDYTVYHTGNPNRVLNRVFALEFQNENFAEQLHYTDSYTGYLDRVPSRVAIWKNLDDLCVTRLITRVTQTVYHPVSWLWTVRMDYTGRHTVCTNRVLHKSLKIDLVWYKFWNGRTFINNIDIIRWIWDIMDSLRPIWWLLVNEIDL